MINELISFALALIVVLILGRPFIALLKELSARQVIRQDGPATHLAKQGTPTMGGVLMLVAASAGILFGCPVKQSWPVLFVLWGYGLLGFWDDSIIVLRRRPLGLKAREKLFFQLLLAALAIVIAREQTFDGSLGPILQAAFWILVLVGTANAVNLTDGLDGLAAGTIALAFGAYAVIGRLSGNHPLTVQSLALAGSCLGFLAYNRHPASVFMGDTGSLALGAALGMVGLKAGSPWLLVVIGLVFVIEALSVILQVTYFKLSGGRRLFRMSPLHHHFELGGYRESRVVAMLWTIGLIGGLVGVMVFQATAAL